MDDLHDGRRAGLQGDVHLLAVDRERVRGGPVVRDRELQRLPGGAVQLGRREEEVLRRDVEGGLARGGGAGHENDAQCLAAALDGVGDLSDLLLVKAYDPLTLAQFHDAKFGRQLLGRGNIGGRFQPAGADDGQGLDLVAPDQRERSGRRGEIEIDVFAHDGGQRGRQGACVILAANEQHGPLNEAVILPPRDVALAQGILLQRHLMHVLRDANDACAGVVLREANHDAATDRVGARP